MVYLGDGRYRITGLIPGMTWQISRLQVESADSLSSSQYRGQAGETIDAGELQIVSTRKAAGQTFPWLAALAKANLSSGTAGEAATATAVANGIGTQGVPGPIFVSPSSRSGYPGDATKIGTVPSPVIERVTVDADKAVIEGRASTNDRIVFIFGEKEAMSQAFPSSVHFKCTVGEGK